MHHAQARVRRREDGDSSDRICVMSSVSIIHSTAQEVAAKGSQQTRVYWSYLSKRLCGRRREPLTLSATM